MVSKKTVRVNKNKMSKLRSLSKTSTVKKVAKKKTMKSKSMKSKSMKSKSMKRKSMKTMKRKVGGSSYNFPQTYFGAPIQKSYVLDDKLSKRTNMNDGWAAFDPQPNFYKLMSS